MKAQTFAIEFPTYDAAFENMQLKNKSYKKANNKADTACVVPGPADNYAVVDHMTAIELDLGYVISVSGWVKNPWTN